MKAFSTVSQPAVASEYIYSAMVGDDEVVEQDKGLYKPQLFYVWRKGTHQGAADSHIGRFTLAPLAGCCGVVVSTDSYLEESWRKTPVVSEHFHKLKEETARKLGYSLMLATTQLRNIPEVVGASKAKWKFIHFFRNKRTDNDLGLMIKDLK